MPTIPLHRLNASSWVYQLQSADLKVLGNTDADVVVIDPYDDEGKLRSKYEIAQLGRDKRVLAYISIGEAESYRPYWNPKWSGMFARFNKPSWLGPENPEWKGNYKVKFWETEWKRIVFSYLDTIVEHGFHGVYLDIIDAYEFWRGHTGLAEFKMVDFVCEIAEHCRAKSSTLKFHVVPQNGEGLLRHEKYRAAISAIGKEDVFYSPDEDGEERLNSEVGATLDLLEQNATAYHIQTLFVEYMAEDAPGDAVEDMRDRIASLMPQSMHASPVYVTTRALDTVTEQ